VEGSDQTVNSGFSFNKASEDFYTFDVLGFWAFLDVDENGNPRNPPRKIYSPPGDFDAFDSSVATSNQGNHSYASLGYFPSLSSYGVVFGRVENTNFKSAFLLKTPIISETLIPVSEKDAFNFVHVERLNNPVRYKVANRQFDGPSGQPDGPLINLITVNSGDLGQLQFFNIISAVQSTENSIGGHVFYIQLNTAKTGTDIMVFHMNTTTGRRDSAPTKLSDLPFFNDFAYGIRAGIRE
jgi:hypothetical protein